MTAPDTSPRRPVPLASAVLLCVLAAGLGVRAAERLWHASALARDSDQYAIEVHGAEASPDSAEVLKLRLAGRALHSFDGLSGGILIVRLQGLPERLARPLLTVVDEHGLEGAGLSDADREMVAAIVRQHPLEMTQKILSVTKAPAIENPALVRRHGLGFSCLAAAAAILGWVLLRRSSAR